jgi:hypothetical protein
MIVTSWRCSASYCALWSTNMFQCVEYQDALVESTRFLSCFTPSKFAVWTCSVASWS